MVYTERLERLFPGQKVSGVIPVSLPPHRTGAVGVGRHIRRRRLPGVPASWTGAGRRRRWRRGRRRWLERSKGKKRGRGDYSSVVIVSLVKKGIITSAGQMEATGLWASGGRELGRTEGRDLDSSVWVSTGQVR